jgi:diguanylate cyclase (GGDEF)-like protein
MVFGSRFGGLAGRLAVLYAILLVVALAGLGVLGFAVLDLQSASVQADRATQVVAQSDRIERSVIDLETGVRGYLLTHEARFLAPTRSAELQLPVEFLELRRLVRDNPLQERRANAMAVAVTAYRRSWVNPTIRSAVTVNIDANTSIGKSKVDALRIGFAGFIMGENRLHARRSAHMRRVERVVIGLLVAVLLLLLGVSFAAGRWTRRRVIRPLVDMQHVVRRFGAGELEARASESGYAEVGDLGRSFNSMADELTRATAALEHQARTDGLTGLANRRYFDEEVERACARARRHASPLSLLVLDIDDFKSINDTLGHVAGDQVLKTVAAVYDSTRRAGDFIARLGGDEFAILLPGTRRTGAETLAAQLQQAVIDCASEWGATFSVSIGVAVATADADPDRLAHEADLEMYASKRNKQPRAA